MLHRFQHSTRGWAAQCVAAMAVALVALLAVSLGHAQSPAPPDAGIDAARPGPFDDPFTARERESLRIRLRPSTAVVRRRGGLPPGMWAPGGARAEAHGWWAGPKRVVTAAAAVEGWPRSRTDHIEVELSDGRRFEAAVGLHEAALGLAVLDVPELPGPKLIAPAGGPDVAVAPGRPLYSADASGLLHRVVVDRHGAGQKAYYHRVLGRLALGTPLFDSTGRVVTLIGAETSEPTVGLVLPAKALRALLERDGWRL